MVGQKGKNLWYIVAVLAGGPDISIDAPIAVFTRIPTHTDAKSPVTCLFCAVVMVCTALAWAKVRKRFPIIVDASQVQSCLHRNRPKVAGVLLSLAQAAVVHRTFPYRMVTYPIYKEARLLAAYFCYCYFCYMEQM